MGSLVRKATGASSIGYGVNILELLPPGVVSGTRSNVVGIVGDFPWGPTNEIQRITTGAELFSTFCPEPFGAANSYAALRAFLRKTFAGGLRIVRILAGSAANATRTFQDAAGTPANSVTVTAACKGALGNSISVAWSVNADDATARDATVTIGTSYSVRYKQVATIVSTALVVTDPGDPYVTFSKASGATLVPAVISATALASGSDGTAVAGDYVGSSSSAKGIRLFYAETADADVDVLFVAECPSALADSINDGLLAYVQDTDKGMAVLCTPDGQSSSTALTYVADYHDDRLVYPWPRAKTTNLYDSDLDEIEVDGNAFVAAAIVALDPELSPGGASGKDALVGITGLEVETTSGATYDDLKDAGVCCFFLSKNLGPILYGGITTSITSGLTQISRRRMTDFITESIAAFAETFVSKPLDLVLASQSLGPETGALVSAIDDFLAGLKGANRIQSYALDAFGGNIQDELDVGRWTIVLSVKLFAPMDEIVLKANIGETVNIEES